MLGSIKKAATHITEHGAERPNNSELCRLPECWGGFAEEDGPEAEQFGTFDLRQSAAAWRAFDQGRDLLEFGAGSGAGLEGLVTLCWVSRAWSGIGAASRRARGMRNRPPTSMMLSGETRGLVDLLSPSSTISL